MRINCPRKCNPLHELFMTFGEVLKQNARIPKGAIEILKVNLKSQQPL